MKMFYWVLAGLFLIGLGTFLIFTRQGATFESKDTTHIELAPSEVVRITIEGVDVTVEIVDTPAERHRGLSGRASLPEGTGMLFDMDTPARHGFWMPDMQFAIDIIWMDEEMHVVDIKENATPESYPEVFKPMSPARFVLEVPADFSRINNIQKGSKAKIETLVQ